MGNEFISFLSRQFKVNKSNNMNNLIILNNWLKTWYSLYFIFSYYLLYKLNNIIKSSILKKFFFDKVQVKTKDNAYHETVTVIFAWN